MAMSLRPGPLGTVPRASFPPSFVVALLALGVVVFVKAVPGVFLVDEINYLVNALNLREGRVTLANTDGLPPSNELVFFDPWPPTRLVEATPVSSTAPPLYGPIALPFVAMGWRGLVALNVVSYIITTALVFGYARRWSRESVTPWLAASAFALGGYAIEYAQGVWPQALSLALVTGGIVAASRLVAGGGPALGAVAGILLGLATGVRYQNVVIMIAVAVAITAWTPRRWVAIALFCLAGALPLTASSVINHERLGSWNPISKGKGYINVPVLQGSNETLLDPVVMAWAQFVDFSVRPPLVGPDFERWLQYDPVTGAHLMQFATVKKAFLQSAPWAVLAFMLAVSVWTSRFKLPDEHRRQMRYLSLVMASIFTMFAFAGVGRHDGLAFNQRYLLELLPLCAVVFAWALDGLRMRVPHLLLGAGVGAAAVLLILASGPATGGPEIPRWSLRVVAILKTPLVLAGVFAIAWFTARTQIRARSIAGFAAGLCLGWGLLLHLADDVFASHRTRRYTMARTQALADVLPDRSALVAWWWHRDPAAVLLLDRDIVILDIWADNGRAAPALIRHLLDQGRRVLLLEDDVPAPVLQGVTHDLKTTRQDHLGLKLLELRR